MKTTESTFKSFDNRELFYRTWEHEVESNGHILLLLHRGHEHSERLASIAAKKEFAGMSIGNRYGFDSGVTLDHVYANKPKGKTFIGKLIDKNYINSIGWRGIRQRKVHLVQSIQTKIERLQKEGKAVHILDIAGGPARYLVEIAKANPKVKVHIRDYQEQNVQEGEALAKEMNVENISYEQCDAFDLASYEEVEFEPNIVIVSGIFELFSDNELIANAMKGLSNLIEKEGYLLYTGQPWHPQLELIANVLGNHQQEKWIMRRRSWIPYLVNMGLKKKR